MALKLKHMEFLRGQTLADASGVGTGPKGKGDNC